MVSNWSKWRMACTYVQTAKNGRVRARFRSSKANMQPGYTQVPNEILEAMPDMGEAESKLTAVLIRLTYGYHRQEVKLKWDEMETLAKISRGGLSIAMKAVEKRGFFRRGRLSMWYVNSSEFELNKVQELDNSSNSELNEDENSSNSELDKSSNSEPFHSYKENSRKEKDPPTPQAPPSDLVEEVISAWNEAFPDKPAITERNRSIRKKLSRQLKDKEFQEVWRDALKAAKQSAYLTGESWFTLDWFCGNGKNGRMPGYMRCLVHEFAWKDQGHTAVFPNGKTFEDIINEVDLSDIYGN